MTKPIIIIRFPHKEDFNFNPILEKLSKHSINEEYHVLVLQESELKSIEFETHNVLNATDIDLEDLKKQLETNLIKK